MNRRNMSFKGFFNFTTSQDEREKFLKMSEIEIIQAKDVMQ